MKVITKGSAFKNILFFAFPLILSNLLAQSYNIIDLIVAGKAIGSKALSATGCTTTLIQFLSSLFWGFGVAVATITGELYGASKHKEIPQFLKTIMLAIFALMGIICVACVAFSTTILELFKVDPVIFDDANAYFKIYMIALLLQALSYQFTSFLHGVGDSKTVLVSSAISGLGNLLLNMLFVLVFNWGVRGLAVATVISSLIGFIYSGAISFKLLKKLNDNPTTEFSWEVLKSTCKLALPCIIQQCSLYLSSILVQPYINGMGESFSSAYSLAMNANLLFNAFYHAISRSVATYCSQSKGAKEYQNLSKGIWNGVLIQIMLVTPFMVLSIIFPEIFFRLFARGDDVAFIPMAKTFVYYCVPFLYFICFGNLMHSFYKSVEATKTVMLSTFLFTVARVAFTYIIPENGKLSSVYFGLSAAWIFEAILLGTMYFIGKWKSKEQRDWEISRQQKKSA